MGIDNSIAIGTDMGTDVYINICIDMCLQMCTHGNGVLICVLMCTDVY